MEQEKEVKPFKPYNIFGRVKRSANYNYLYKRSYKKFIKNMKKAEKRDKKTAKKGNK